MVKRNCQCSITCNNCPSYGESPTNGVVTFVGNIHAYISSNNYHIIYEFDDSSVTSYNSTFQRWQTGLVGETGYINTGKLKIYNTSNVLVFENPAIINIQIKCISESDWLINIVALNGTGGGAVYTVRTVDDDSLCQISQCPDNRPIYSGSCSSWTGYYSYDHSGNIMVHFS